MQSRLTATSASRLELGFQARTTVPGLHGGFLVETGFLHVAQAGLELPTSDDLPTSTSQNAGITDVSHRAQLMTLLHSFFRSSLCRGTYI